ncbi:MAG: ornithine carbamoyltransferase [Verrucomicrobiota bacterium]|nr:ornithine carbamoyltransferase [Verrucomicrobiota bacterium]
MKHLLKLEGMSKKDMLDILDSVKTIKAGRGTNEIKTLDGQTWAMIFTKSSTRTRVSFEVGIRELGGSVMFLNSNDMQLGRGEPIKDTARVLGRMVHGAVIRTYAQSDVEEFASLSNIPTINALTDDEHPCQILTDIFTFEEARGPIQGKVVTYVGDGACNVPLSWIHAAATLDFELRIAAPVEFQPNKDILTKAKGNISCTEDIRDAVKNTDMVYTDVWVSMGMESEEEKRLSKLANYQINDDLMSYAKPDALVMHCLPAYRGKEIDQDTFEANAETIFTQAENRLHTQKAILTWLTN